jgi:hypothetical protein
MFAKNCAFLHFHRAISDKLQNIKLWKLLFFLPPVVLQVYQVWIKSEMVGFFHSFTRHGMTRMTDVGATSYCDCYCTPDPLTCSYNSKLLSRDYHYKQSCEPNVGMTGGAIVTAQSRSLEVDPWIIFRWPGCVVALSCWDAFQILWRRNRILDMEPAEVAKITRFPYVRRKSLFIACEPNKLCDAAFSSYAVRALRQGVFERLHSTRALLQMTVVSRLLDPAHLF